MLSFCRALKSTIKPIRNGYLCTHRLRSSTVPESQTESGPKTKRRLEVGEAQSLLDIGVRDIFTEEHDLFRQNVRRFYKEEIVPHNAEWEKAGQVSREAWEKAGSNGLLGVNTPSEVGGVGGDYLSAAVVHEEQMYVNISGTGFHVHSDIVMPYISHYGTPEQIRKFIPPMTAGKCIGAIAMTEPSAGSDLQGIRTHAKRDGDDWILNGSKVFITNGWMSDVCIVAALTNPDAKSPAHGMSLFLVESGMPGFKKGRKLEKIGMKAQDTAELFFDDVRLPKESLLGEPGKGFYYMMKELPQERLMIATLCLGTAEFVFEETRSYVKQRKAFKKTLSNLQTIQHKLAETKTEICVGRAFIDKCLDIHNKTGLDSQQASMAKMWASDMCFDITHRCLQLHGGWGYMWEYPIAKAFVDTRVCSILGGSNEIMKELIAGYITK